jgi:hypothetical protein
MRKKLSSRQIAEPQQLRQQDGVLFGTSMKEYDLLEPSVYRHLNEETPATTLDFWILD